MNPIEKLLQKIMGEEKYTRFKKSMEVRIRDFRHSLHELRQVPISLAGLSFIIFFLVLAFLGPHLVPNPSRTRNVSEKLDPPSREHPLGVDRYGGDILGRILYALRKDLTLSLAVVVSAIVIGIIIGAIAGYMGGIVDEALMRVTEVFLSFPSIVLALAVVSILKARGFEVIIYALVVAWWPKYSRVVRGDILAEKEKLYVEAARAIGLSRIKILFKHILPNIVSTLFVLATLDMGYVLLTAAGLAFIGVGIMPGSAELGLMISEGRNFISSCPWYIGFPGLVVFFVVLGFNLFGDALRDILDPRLRR